jgi:uncharacterized protein DUF6498
MRWVSCLVAPLLAACAFAHAGVEVAELSIRSTWRQPEDSERALYFPGDTTFRVILENLVPGRTYVSRIFIEDGSRRILAEENQTFVGLFSRQGFFLDHVDTYGAAPGDWKFVLLLDGTPLVNRVMRASVRPPEYPPLTLVRAVITSSISRNLEPRRPLETLKLPSMAYYYVEATGFLPGKNYQVRAVVLDGAKKVVLDRSYSTQPRSARHVVWSGITPKVTGVPGQWTFRLYLGGSAPAPQLVAQTTIEAGAQGGRSKEALLERLAPALGVSVLCLLAYVAYSMVVHSRGMPAGPQVASKRGIASLIALIAVNLLPLGFAYFFEANAADILIIYWFENLVIAFYALLRMLSARAEGPQGGEALLYVPIFLLHFGLFSSAHAGILLHYAWTDSNLFALHASSADAGREFWDVVPVVLVIQVATLFISHGMSFVQNYLKGGEYLAATPREEMTRPYHRVFIMHVAAVGSGLLATAHGSPLAMLVIVVLLKTGLDVYFHVRSHRVAIRPVASTRL